MTGSISIPSASGTMLCRFSAVELHVASFDAILITAMRTLVLIVALTAAMPALGAEAPKIFQNEWCWCLLPTIVAERPSSRSNVGYSMAVGADGRIYFAGTEPRSEPDLGSGWTLKAMSQAGEVVWSRTFTWRRNYYDVARSIALCPDGRIAVAGYSEFSRNSPIPARWLVGVYSADGQPVWSDTISDANLIRAEAAACDPDGRLTVVGWRTRRQTVQSSFWLIRSYKPDGKTAWTRTFGGDLAGRDRAHAVAAEKDGHILVAGKLDEGSGRSAWCLLRLTPKGAVSWSRTFTGPDSWQDEPCAVAVGKNGRIALAGKVSAGPADRVNWMVMVLDGSGNRIWSRTHNGEKSMDDKAFAVTFDGCGRVIVAGYENGDASQNPPYDAGEWAVHVYTPDGELIRHMHRAEMETMPGSAFGAALVPDGVLIAGFEQTSVIGQTRWIHKKVKLPDCAGKKEAPATGSVRHSKP